jgi:hypothetical protein
MRRGFCEAMGSGQRRQMGMGRTNVADEALWGLSMVSNDSEMLPVYKYWRRTIFYHATDSLAK